MKLNIRTDTLWMCFWILILGSTGMKWIPIFKLGTISIEIHNAVVLGLLAIFGFQIITTRKFAIPYFILILCILCIWLTLIMGLHNKINLSPVIQCLPVAIGALALTNSAYNPTKDLTKITIGMALIMSLSLIVSAEAAGLSLIDGIVKYFQSFNRLQFLMGTVRPLFNAFIIQKESLDVPIYDSWLLNHLSASFYILFVMSVSCRAKTTLGSVALIISACLSLFVIFSLFSSSVIIALFYSLMYLVVQFIKSRQNPIFITIAVFLGVLSVLIIAPKIFNYISFMLMDDAASASSRTEQYLGALEGIGENPLFGVGPRTFFGHSVHNLFLASFMMTGIIGGILSISIFIIAFYWMFIGWKGLIMDNQTNAIHNAILAMMPMIFVVRAGLQGGFGLPSNAEVFALILAYVVKKSREFQHHSSMLPIESLTRSKTFNSVFR